MNLAHWLAQTARAWPGRPALMLGSEVLADYQGFESLVRARAARLAGRGIRAGDRVALYAANTPEYLVALLASWWIGAVAVPVNRKLHPEELRWIAGDAALALVLTDAPGLQAGPEAPLDDPDAPVAAVPDSPVSLPDDTLAWLFYTSGTTGRPKGVMLTHGNLVQMTLCFAQDVDQLRPEDRMLYAAPASHGAGLYALPAIRAGAAHLFPASQGFDTAEILDLADRVGNLVFFAAPTMVKRLVSAARARGHAGEGIRTIIYGGGPMYAADIDEALALFGPRFVQIYGQGECPMTITALPRALVADRGHPQAGARRASVGYAQAAVEVVIRDPEGRALPAGETGEITVRGPLVMAGYWRNPEATAKAIRDGWLWTGDVGHLDPDGFLTLTDRSKDVIISGGSNIYPREVEEVLLHHPEVAEVSVIGMADDDWGEVVVACVVGSAEPETLNRFCRDRIAAFKAPKRYVFLPELPKNAYGKVLKTDLRSMLRPQGRDKDGA